MGEPFTNVQRRMWWFLAHIGIFIHYIDINPKGRYQIKTLGIFGVAWFYFFCCNIAFKFVYHVLTYKGFLIPIHFLDQMSMWDWFLMYGHVFFECTIWYFKYPMWENLYRQWELQEDIYRKLGRPSKMSKKIIATDSLNFVLYFGICLIGTTALGLQFYSTPKYALNTYAIIPGDNAFLRFIFCMHECFFIGPGYVCEAFTMVLAQSYAVSYQHLLEEMNKALNYLIHHETYTKVLQSKRHSPNNQNKQPNGAKRWNTIRLVNPKRKAVGTDYDIATLVEDYRKVMISAQFHNQWIGAIMGVPEALNYGQFVCDVFMMIQLLKEGDTDYFAVGFYVMDAIFGMFMVFRMLIILSRLYPQGEKFLDGLKYYATLRTPLRKELLKTIPSLRVISAKLTGCTIKPECVPMGMHVLINWYIAAAMWERPTDRKT